MQARETGIVEGMEKAAAGWKRMERLEAADADPNQLRGARARAQNKLMQTKSKPGDKAFSDWQGRRKKFFDSPQNWDRWGAGRSGLVPAPPTRATQMRERGKHMTLPRVRTPKKKGLLSKIMGKLRK